MNHCATRSSSLGAGVSSSLRTQSCFGLEPGILTELTDNSLKKIIKKVLTPETHLNTTDDGESRGPAISRNCERHREPFARPVFGRFCRLALGGEYKLLRRSRLDGGPSGHSQPAVEHTKCDYMGFD